MQCPKCKKYFHSLGIMNHRKNCPPKPEIRHRCLYCKRRRAETFMLFDYPKGWSTRYWFCKIDCRPLSRTVDGNRLN